MRFEYHLSHSLTHWQYGTKKKWLWTWALDGRASQILPIRVKVTFCTFYVMTQAFLTRYSEPFHLEKEASRCTLCSVCSGASISLLYPSVLVGPVGVWRSQECESGSHSHSVSRESVRLRGQCTPHRPSHKRGPFSISLLSGDTSMQIGSSGLTPGQQELQQESSVPLLLSSLLMYLPLFFSFFFCLSLPYSFSLPLSSIEWPWEISNRCEAETRTCWVRASYRCTVITHMSYSAAMSGVIPSPLSLAIKTRRLFVG